MNPLRLLKIYKIYKFFFLSHLEKKLFWKALFWLSFSKWAIPNVSFKQLQKYLGEAPEELNRNLNFYLNPERNCVQLQQAKQAKQTKQVKQVKAAISRARKILPFHCQCLVTAICARKLLKDLGSAPELYLGVAKETRENRALEPSPDKPSPDNPSSLMAHAWVKLGNEFVVGKSEIDFTVVKIFI